MPAVMMKQCVCLVQAERNTCCRAEALFARSAVRMRMNIKWFTQGNTNAWALPTCLSREEKILLVPTLQYNTCTTSMAGKIKQSRSTAPDPSPKLLVSTVLHLATAGLLTSFRSSVDSRGNRSRRPNSTASQLERNKTAGKTQAYLLG